MALSRVIRTCLIPILGLMGAVGALVVASFGHPAAAQTGNPSGNPYCQAAYYNAHYCQCYECASVATSTGPNPRGGFGGG